MMTDIRSPPLGLELTESWLTTPRVPWLDAQDGSGDGRGRKSMLSGDMVTLQK
jgi:hypothetical protein